MNLDQQIKTFFASSAYGVVGASNNRDKYGNKVLRVYLQNAKQVFPVNPNEDMVEGVKTVPNVGSLPENVESISIITPPPITEKIVQQAISKGIKNIWMQPGAENAAAIQECKKHNINVIAGGPCILVELHYHEY